MNIIVYVTWYLLNEDGGREITWQSRQDLWFDSTEEIVEYLIEDDLVEFSSWPDFAPNGWFSADTYVDPWTSEREERTAHCGELSEQQWRHVWARMTTGTVSPEEL